MPFPWHGSLVPPTTLRECRLVLTLSQSAFAAALGVSAESYRPWDAGRRVPPDAIVAKAQLLAARVEASRLLPLDRLAAMIRTHVRTLRAAARDGRLRVTYETQTTFSAIPDEGHARRCESVPPDTVPRTRAHGPATDRADLGKRAC